MTLAAIYIYKHDYLFDKPQIINFGGKYIYYIEMDDSKFISIERKENEDFIKNFWGEEISLISAIVGANGAGKTNLCWEIYRQMTSGLIHYDKIINDINYFIIYESNEETFLRITDVNVIKGYGHDIFDNENDIEEDISNRHTEIFNKKIIFKDNISTLSFKDLFTTKLDIFEQIYFYNPLQYFNNKISISNEVEINNNLKFLSDEVLISHLENIYEDLKFYKKIKISTNNFSFNFRSIDAHIYRNLSPKKMITDIEFDTMFRDKYIVDGKYYFFVYLDQIFKSENLYTAQHDINGYKIYNNKKIDDKLFDFNCQLIARVFYYIFTIDEFIYQKLCDKVIHLIVYENLNSKKLFNDVLNDIIIFLQNEITEEKLKIVLNIKELSEEIPDDLILELNDYNLTKNNRILYLYNIISKSINIPVLIAQLEESEHIANNFLIFEPESRPSQGERFLIKLFSNIYASREAIKNLIILDEPEMGFHPKWKKKFVKAIAKIIPVILGKNANNQIQIIFTTHDALTLSDIPNSNIVYIAKSKNISEILNGNERPKKSFGANITDLLADSFFFGNDDKALIGDFAKEKIEEVIEWIKNKKRDNEKKEYHRKVIELIDEPLLKRKLSEMFDEATSEDLELSLISKEIKYLQEREKELLKNSNKK